uniref:IRS-type PTB domain-containing protein n=1 Tax=Romanomermis culicivorax TaxID=13658 RepID=A0A915KPG7_ROMCU
MEALLVQVHGQNYKDTIKRLYAENGWNVLHKGLSTRLITIPFSSFLLIVGYEFIKRLSVLPDLRHKVSKICENPFREEIGRKMTLEETLMIEGMLKVWNGKKWKSRYCVAKKSSPIANAVEFVKYKNEKFRRKEQTKMKLVVIHDYSGFETRFMFEKESEILAVLYDKNVLLLAFENSDKLTQWALWFRTCFGYGLGATWLILFRTKKNLSWVPQDGHKLLIGTFKGVARIFSLGGEHFLHFLIEKFGVSAFKTHQSDNFRVQAFEAPLAANLMVDQYVRIHLQDGKFCMSTKTPPIIVMTFPLTMVRSYGALQNHFYFVLGSKAGELSGTYNLLTGESDKIEKSWRFASEKLLHRLLPIEDS